MDECGMYILPQKAKCELTRTIFIVYCIAWAVGCFALLNVITIWMFGSSVGYFSVWVVLIAADVLHLIGCLYYIRKHDFAYGRHYSKCHIANSVIYGIQNYLRVLLLAMVISIVIVPLYYTIILLAITVAMFRWTRRL